MKKVLKRRRVRLRRKQELPGVVAPLPLEEELRLARRMRLGDKSAADKLIRASLPAVEKLALPYLPSGVALEDLMGAGVLGLMQALQKFDPSRGVRLITFAWKHIHREIIEEAARRPHVHVPRRTAAKVLRAQKKCAQTFQGNPRHSNVLRQARVSEHEFAAIEYALRTPGSFQEAFTVDDGLLLEEVVADEHALPPDAVLTKKRRHEWLQHALVLLTNEQSAVVEMHFGLGTEGERSLKEVGQCFQRTCGWVWQVEHQALAILRLAAKS